MVVEGLPVYNLHHRKVGPSRHRHTIECSSPSDYALGFDDMVGDTLSGVKTPQLLTLLHSRFPEKCGVATTQNGTRSW
jgi:hypothetical protein